MAAIAALADLPDSDYKRALIAVAEFAVQRIVRPYRQPANREMAERLGTDRWFRMVLSSEQDMEEVAARGERVLARGAEGLPRVRGVHLRALRALEMGEEHRWGLSRSGGWWRRAWSGGARPTARARSPR